VRTYQGYLDKVSHSLTAEEVDKLATITPYATGATNSATDKTQGTATGIMKLQQAAGDIIAFMRSNFQQSMHQIGTMWLSNNQQYLDRAVTVPGKKGMNEEVHPAMLQGDMELRIDDASMEPVSREEQKASYLQFIQQTLALQNASIAQAQATQGKTEPLIIDFKEMFENISDKFGMKSSDDLLVDQKDMEQQPGMQEGMQEGEDMGMPMEQPPMEQMPMEQMPPEMQGMPPQGMPQEDMQQPPNGGMY
jgi:hypothetical protein